MKALPAILLLASLTATPLVGTASARNDSCNSHFPDEACQLLAQIQECLDKPVTLIPDCLGLKGTFCMSFHIGLLMLNLPHLTRERIQFAGVGAEFTIPPRIQTTSTASGAPSMVGFGVFTIDLNSDGRTC
jgi:hypothetical protein